MMIQHLQPEQAYRDHAGERVRVIWNPQVKLWYVYNLTEDRPIFSTFRLEIHTVGVYGELRPKYAPEGSPSFVGTIVAHEIVEEGDRIKAHPYAPSKMFFEKNGEAYTFNHCRRLLLDKNRMIADNRPISKGEHEKTI